MGGEARSCADCRRQVVGKIRRGRCENCYRAHLRDLKRAGEFSSLASPTAVHPGVKILSNVTVTAEGCWLYQGFVNRQGYGVLDFSRKASQARAHRAVWEHLIGAIPDDLELDHLCHGADDHCPGGPRCMHRRCVNPEHLEPVTPEVNTRRGLSEPAKNARKTHCIRGHEFSPQNTAWRTSATRARPRRHCLACHREWRAKRASTS